MRVSRSLLWSPIALLAGALAVPDASRAQCRLCEVPTTSNESTPDASPLALDIQARLDFDRLILTDTSPGRIRLAPDGSTSTSGSVGTISGRAMVGSVVVRGEPGRLVRVSFPSSVELTSPTGSAVRLSDLASDLPTAARLDSAGQLTFRFGGQIDVSGNVDGSYRGDFAITVDYL